MLVKARDSRDSGTDFAIIRDTDLILNKINTLVSFDANQPTMLRTWEDVRMSLIT